MSHSGRGGSIGVGRACVAGLVTAMLVLAAPAGAQTTVTVHGTQYYLYQQMELTKAAGEVAFDPTDGNRPYLAYDADNASGTGSIYKCGFVDGALTLLELVAQGGSTNEAFEAPSGMVFDANGDLYVVEDYDGFLARVNTPRTGAPYVADVIVGKHLFGTTTGDDDPIAIAPVPPGFNSTLAPTGDLVFVDRGYNNNNSRNAIYTYTPGETIGAFFNELLSTYTQLDPVVGTADFNDLSFSQDGTTLYGITSTGKVIKIDPAGNVTEQAITGVTFGLLQALGTNPLDGRLWIADDTTDQVWSVDPSTGEARLELTFARAGATAPDVIQFHFPGLQFSSDGEYFTVSDISPSPFTLFLFRRVTPGNVPPTARVAVDPATRIQSGSENPVVFTLDATASDDGDGGTQGLTYLWVNVNGTPGVTIDQPTAAITTVTVPGEVNYPGAQYTIRLIVSDGQDQSISSAVLSVSEPTEVILPPGSYFNSGKRVFMTGMPGEVAVDPTTGDIYVANDVADGGIFRLTQSLDGSYAIGEQVASLVNPCGMAVTPDGKLWWVRDLTGNETTPYFGRVDDLRTGPPYPNTGLITNFGATTGDDDPFVIKVVPAGFATGGLSEGDLLIGDIGVDGNTPIAIYVYHPAAPVGDVTSYMTTFMASSAEDSSPLRPYDGFDIVDMEFSPDGTRLYVVFTNGQIIQVNAAGTVDRQISAVGVTFANLEGLAVNPVDGRLWIADDNLDQIWSFNPDDSELAILEAEFNLPGESLHDYNINFHDPSLTFTPDGQRLIITDTGRDSLVADGWVWVLDVAPPPSTAPDFDADDDVDLNDMATFVNCMTGPTIPVVTPADCVSADLDKDGDVDIADFAVMQRCFSGANILWSLDCLIP